MHNVKDPLSLPKVLHTSYEPFARTLGILVTPTTLPYFQMGSNVIWNKMPHLGWSACAFSLVKHNIHFAEPEILSYDTPLWHSTLFLNQRCLDYFDPRLIRPGVLTVGQLLEDDTFFFLRLPPCGSQSINEGLP